MRPRGQQKVAAFWSGVHGLPGIAGLVFSSKGLQLTADGPHLTALVPQYPDAALPKELQRVWESLS